MSTEKQAAQQLLDYLASLSPKEREAAIKQINEGPADGPVAQLARLRKAKSQ